ncbi:MAG: phosphatase domain-containing protein [Candidatus Competibacter denitrificans]|jgi:phosphatidate phosphatase APP1
MATWKDSAHRLGYLIDTHFDRLRYGLKRRLGYDQPLQVVPYDGYGNQETLFLTGRVLEDHGDIDTTDQETLWSNLVASYRRFGSDEVPGLQIRATFQDRSVETVTDREGYFHVALPVMRSLDPDLSWQSITLSVPPQAMLRRQPPEPVTGRVLTPAPHCDFGIISDIDDTILITGATSLLRMARLTFLRSPSSRLPFNGVAAFYQALQTGGPYRRPLFYISSSPWNLYDFLVDFMGLNGIPAGPLLLRDFGVQPERTIGSSHQAHKLAQIERVMKTYPKMPFILIGDSGQHDPEAYAQVVATRPQQVLAIYIRDVTQNPQRDAEIALLAAQVQLHKIALLLVENTLQAAEHAARHGYIDSATLPSIRADHARSAEPLDLIEHLVGEDD